jgi:hypothetical protein
MNKSNEDDEEITEDGRKIKFFSMKNSILFN